MVHQATLGQESSKEAASPEIAKLIQQLASDSYAARMRARRQIQRLGLEAFDELQVAQDSEVVEIAASARYLISSLLVSWSDESDPPAVRDALNEYGAQDASERSSRIQLLAELPERKGLEALARLARYETSLKLSRQAALALMQQAMSDDAGIRKQNAQVIEEIAQDKPRQATQWLRVYANDLRSGDYSADQWSKLVKQQRREVDAVASQTTTRASVLDLVRVCAKRSLLAGNRDEAIRLAVENSDLIPPTTRDLVDACSWAIDNQLHEFVISLKGKHERMFNQHANLLYATAEAWRVAGDQEKSNAMAGDAIKILPFPQTEEAKDNTSPSRLDEIAHAHREIGQELEARGLFDWAEKEFQLILDNMELEALSSVSTRTHLGRMLGELNRHDDVIRVLQPLIKRADNDDAFKNRMRFGYFQIDYIRSQIEFHKGLKKLDAGEMDEGRKLLMKSYQLNRDNIDILIRMYHTEGDEDWTTSVNRLLNQAIRQSEMEIRTAEARIQNGFQNGNEYLAEKLNQYAWLVSNTEGDRNRALRESLRSLKLTPGNAAQLDTAARCYLSLGRLDEAKKMQKKALRIQPHSPPMLRQLKEIETAAAEEKVQQ